MLNLEQEKERYKSEVENVKAFLAEELQLSGNVTVWNRYKRECTDELERDGSTIPRVSST